MAVDLVGSAPEDGNNTAAAVTDISGAQVSPEDVQRIEDSLKKF